MDEGPRRSKPFTFQEVYETYVEAIYRFVYRRVGNRPDAEDITSQVFLKALKGLDLSRPDQSIAGWLYQTAETSIADYWRQFYRYPKADPPEDWPEPGAFSGHEEGPAASRVVELLAKLPENYRRVLELRFLEGLSIRETAQRMGISESNAKVLQHRALRMAAKLDGEL